MGEQLGNPSLRNNKRNPGSRTRVRDRIQVSFTNTGDTVTQDVRGASWEVTLRDMILKEGAASKELKN